MKKWASAEELFANLNHYEYIVIRNFEGFFDSILLDSHADIDILINPRNRKQTIDLLGAVPRLDRNDGIHYKVLIEDEYVPFDIRTVGDGYYDKKWEMNMLLNRVYDEKGFYHMCNADYFWSLLYHSLYHKGQVSEEYRERLKKLNISEIAGEKRQQELLLASYMKNHDYYYTIAKDRYLWYHFTELCKGRIKAYPLYPVAKLLMNCKEFLQYRLGRKSIKNESQ